MRTYVYCSYTNSPVGFLIGAFNFDPMQKNFYIPTKNVFNDFVVEAFEEGFVSKMYGCVPFIGKYIFLVKKFQKNNVNDPIEGVIDFYMNFAFEFDSFEEYKNFCENFNALPEETIANECARFIVPDRHVENFALKVDAKVFNKFVTEMLKKTTDKQVNEKLFVEVVSPQIEESQLQKIFKLDFSKDDKKTFVYPAKKISLKKTFPIVPTIAALIFVILIVICFLVR